MSETTQSNGGVTGKILQGGGEGMGTVTPEMVEQRGLELAKADGRTEPNEGDLASARAELLGVENEELAPEAVDDEDVENLTAWDSAPEEAGAHVPNIIPENDDNLGEVLVAEGLSEADHNQRISAAEENPPEEL